MKKTVEIQPLAETDIENAWLDTLERWGVEQADAYVDKLTARIQMLCEHPEAGRACHELREGYRKLLVGHHVAFYRLNGEAVEVCRVLHEKMDFESHL